MLEDSSEELEKVRKEWDELSKRYDMYFTTFEGKLDRYLKWRVIKENLPENKAARILDAGGGTGIVTLPLAKMGYRVTLCDLSPGQLRVAEDNFELNHAHGAHGFGRVFSPKELRELFESNGITVMGIHGDFVYSLPEEMRKATNWEKRLYAQVTDIIDHFNKEPSISGLGSELILVGEKI